MEKVVYDPCLQRELTQEEGQERFRKWAKEKLEPVLAIQEKLEKISIKGVEFQLIFPDIATSMLMIKTSKETILVGSHVTDIDEDTSSIEIDGVVIGEVLSDFAMPGLERIKAE